MDDAAREGRRAVAQVSELLEQAKALEAQGESAKALAIYRHLLPHLKDAPAIAAEVAVKAGEILLAGGDQPSAYDMFERAAGIAAAHGSARKVLSVGARMVRAAPDRTDIYLQLGRRMVEAGHAGPAVDVLMEHARQRGLEQMVAELQPLSGRPSDDVRPQVAMLLEGLVEGAPPAPAEPPVPPPEPALPPPPALPTWASPPPAAASPPPPVAPPEPVLPPPPPLPTWASPPPPPPLPAAPAGVDPDLELGSMVPSTKRESQLMEARARLSSREIQAPPEPPEPPRRRSSAGRAPRIPEPERKPRGGFVVMVLLALGLGGGAWWFTHREKGDTVTTVDSAPSRPAPPRRRAPASRPSQTTAPPSAAMPSGTPVNPPVLIGGLTLDTVTALPDGGFRIVHRNDARDLIEMIARPLGDTLGEPDPGQVRLDSVPGGTNTAVTSFEGFVIVVRSQLSPADLRSLVGRIYAVPR